MIFAQNRLECQVLNANLMMNAYQDLNVVMVFAPCNSECLEKIVLLMKIVDQVWNAETFNVLYLFLCLETNALQLKNVNLVFSAVMKFALNHSGWSVKNANLMLNVILG